MIDMHLFKSLAHGHVAGDAVLQQVQQVQQFFRPPLEPPHFSLMISTRWG
ncbi:hypothetical protein [Pseudorhodoferax sp. Leaf265]|nr:hypothetical protein [Pseudorhodoferax sp. Leaf265]